MSQTPVVTVDPVHPDPALLAPAAELLRGGGLVVFPTETVYGLGANALDQRACHGIYEAKGRPSDNPLIVHLPDTERLPELCRTVPPEAVALFRAFAPGPLTLVLPKSGIVPDLVSGGLDTVAVRIPSHPVAQALLRACGVPVAAPSANRSGRPSPTSLQHVLEDLDGRVDLFVDGGPCGVGLESTVLSLAGETPLLLRPGGVSLEQLRELLGEVRVDPAVLAQASAKTPPQAPGMKYRHYAPKAPLIALDGDHRSVLQYMRERQARGRVGILCYEGEEPLFRQAAALAALGPLGDHEVNARRLFDALRSFDAVQLDRIYAPLPDAAGLGLALRNRLLKAAGHHVIEVE